MGRRTIALSFLLLASCSSPDPLPHIGSDPVDVIWTADTEDLISCYTVAPLLRQLQSSHGRQIKLQAWILGTPADTSLINTFLKRERLDSEYRLVGYREFADELRGISQNDAPDVPTIYIVTHTRNGQQIVQFRPSLRNEDVVSSYVGQVLDEEFAADRVAEDMHSGG